MLLIYLYVPCIFSIRWPSFSDIQWCTQYWFLQGGTSGKMLNLYILLLSLYVNNLRFSLCPQHVQCIHGLIHYCIPKDNTEVLFCVTNPCDKMIFKFWIDLYDASTWWLCGSTSWYLLHFSALMYSLIFFDASLSMMLRMAFYPLSTK